MKAGLVATLLMISLNAIACDPAPDAQAALTKNFKPLNHDEFSKATRSVKAGLESDKLLKLLGEPTCRLKNEWNYDASRLDGFHMPKQGEQVVTNASFLLADDKVTTVKLGTVDATGPNQRD